MPNYTAEVDLTKPQVEVSVGVPGVTDHGALNGLEDDDHTHYGLVVISATEPTNPRVGTIWVPST